MKTETWIAIAVPIVTLITPLLNTVLANRLVRAQANPQANHINADRPRKTSSKTNNLFLMTASVIGGYAPALYFLVETVQATGAVTRETISRLL